MKRQANILSSLISNFETVEEVIETSMNSSGSAIAENEKYLDSIAGKSEQLTNAMQSLWNNTISSDAIKYFLDIALGATKAVDAIGLLPSVLAGVLVYFKMFKKIGITSLWQDLSSNIKSYSGAVQSIKSIKSLGIGSAVIGKTAQLDSTTVSAYASALSNLSATQQAATLTSQGFTKAQAAQVLMHNEVDDAIVRQILGTNALNTAKQASVGITGAQAAALIAESDAEVAEASLNWLVAQGEEAVTRAKIKQAVASGVLTSAQGAELISVLGLDAGYKKLTATLGAMMKANPLGWIMTGISVIMMFAPLLEDLFKSTEEKIQELEQEFKDLEEKITTASDNFKSLKSSADEVIPRFAELAQGVDQFGKNVNLTDEEYKEFLSLNNQIADMFPEINNGMDSNGNAMLALSLTANTLEQSLWDLVDAERATANEEIADTMPDVLDNIEKTVAQYKKGTSDIEKEKEALKEAYNLFLKGEPYEFRSAVGASANETLKMFDRLGIDYQVEEVGSTNSVVGSTSYKVTFEKNAEVIKRNYKNALAGLNKEINNINDKVANKWKQINPVVTAWTQTDYTFQGLNEDMQTVVKSMIGNLDFSSLGLITQEKVQNYIKNNILNKIDALTSDAQQKFANLMSLDPSGMSTQAYIDEINKIAKEIEDMNEGWTSDQVLQNTGYNDIIKQYQDTVDKCVDILGEGFEEGSDEFNNLKNSLYSLDPNKLTKAFDIIKKYGIKTWDELVKALENKTFDVVLDYTAESESFEEVIKAIDESTSALGLSSESIEALQKRYQDLESYDPARLFEKTENGIHLNTKALRELEAEYAKQNTEELNSKLEGLTEQYNKLTKEIDDCSDLSKTAELYAQRDEILNQINDTAELAAQYAGLTSAYYKWEKAQSGGNERDMYEGIISGRESMDEIMSRGWVDDEVRAYIDLLSGKDLSTASIDEVLAAYKDLNKEIGNSGYTIFDFFTTNDDGDSTTDGLFNFFDTVRSELGETYAWIDKSGKYHLDFGIGGDENVAEKLNMDVEAVQALMRAANDAGFDVNLDSMYSAFNYLKTEAENANDTLKQLGITASTFNFNTEDLDYLDKQITEVQGILDKFKNEDGTINLSANGAIETQNILATLLSKKQQLTDTSAILNIDVSGVTETSSEIDKAVKLLQDFKTKYQEYEIKLAVGADTTNTEKELDGYLAQMQENSTITGTLKIDPTSKETAVKSINALTPEMIANVLPDDTAIKNYDPNEEAKNALVEYGIDPESEVFKWKAPDKVGTIYYTAASTIGGYIADKIFGGKESDVNGTAHANGSWGAPRTETALTGELGPEILVRNGKWHTIGKNGAEFTQIKKGDIIFNHKQTEELLKNGYVTSRGKAYSGGTAYSDTSGSGVGRSTVLSAHVEGGGANRLADSMDKASDSAEEFAETMDFIAVRIEELSDKIALNEAKLENATSVASKNKIIDQMISDNQTLYDNLLAGANEYYAKAKTYLSQIPKEYRDAAKDGSIALTDFKNEVGEEAYNAIEEYREWVQKGDDLTLQAEQTLTTISDLAKKAIDNISTTYDNKNSLHESEKDQLDAQNEYIEETTGFKSEEINNAIIAANKSIINNKQIERDKMQAGFDEKVESGEIKKYSQEWYDVVNAISAVDTEIINLKKENKDLVDENTDIYWEQFDFLIEKYESVNDQADNLIDILSNSDMFDDSGEWTDAGITSLGLYAQKMETAQVKAEEYKNAISYLDKNWKKLGYTEKEYLAKRSELEKSQASEIKAYHDSKDAIVDLNKERINAIKDGIQAEIDAYNELIDKKKEELDAEQDLYDFQKKSAEHTKNIADIDRKLAALAGDNSASAVAQRKKLEAERAEAVAEQEDFYYQRSVENQKKALDDEKEAFADSKNDEIAKWDEYLDNTELLVTDSINSVKSKADVVLSTLNDTAKEYGLVLSDTLKQPWEDGAQAIQAYNDAFGIDGKGSETTKALDKTKKDQKKTETTNSKTGTNAVKQTKDNSAKYQSAKKKTTTKKDTKKDTKKETAKTIKEGGKINAKGAKIYGYKGGTAYNQYFASDPIYKVLDIDGKWLKVRHHKASSGVTGWFKKADVKAYAKGTLGAKKSQLALIDELGEELQLIPGQNGRLEYIKKGTGIVPADLTERLMDLAMNPQEVLDRNRPAIAPSKSVVNNTMEINVDASVGTLLHVEHLNGNNPDEVTKLVNKAWEKKMQGLNNSIKKFSR